MLTKIAERLMPLTDKQIETLREQFHVYVQDNSRLSIALVP